MFFVALCLLLITFTGCGDTEWWNKFKESAGLSVTHTGRYPNGNIKFQRTYWKGMLSGTSKEYYEDGQIKEIANYENNVFHGERLVYSEKGHLRVKDIYKDGLLISEAFFEPDNGTLISTSLYEYKDGKLKNNTTNYRGDNHKDIEIYNDEGKRKYIIIYDSNNNFVSRIEYDLSGDMTFITKQEGGFQVVYDRSWKILGKWDADGNYYNANGQKIGHAGPDGKMILDEQSSPNQMSTRKSK